MTITSAARQREEFLNRLDAAMQSLPHGVATEIRGGIAEELEGLDAEATASRIAQLGDPEVIAREAAQADGVEPRVVIAANAKRPATSTKGYAIVAALVLSFGGIILPGIGWVIGAVMVCAGALWKTWEKVVAIVVPLAAAAFVVLAGLGAWQAEAPASAEAVNPLVPAQYDFVWATVFGLGVALIPASGLWLIWRLRRR